MRGTRAAGGAPVERRRFIPAYAGDTPYVCSGRPACAVHPRVCGEHISQESPRLHGGGSSPRMRGTHLPAPMAKPDTRFIPAYAGNTISIRELPGNHAVHPRVCGEHAFMPLLPTKEDGSSPRMRGTRAAAQGEAWRGRFIPAYAGNTTAGRTGGPACAVHPRVCGEYYHSAQNSTRARGSSPRMRGTRSQL